MFIGRKKELSDLEAAYSRNGFQLFVVFGLEGAGKTVLLQEFCKGKDNVIFFTPSENNASINLQEFSSMVFNHYRRQTAKPVMVWDTILQFIADQEHKYVSDLKHRLILVLDEFPEPSRRDQLFVKMFQNAITNYFSHTNVFMVVTNSGMKFMQEFFLVENSILFRSISGYIYLEHFVLDDAAVKEFTQNVVKTEQGIKNASMKMQKVAADEIILREGEVNKEMYKIISGRAVCYFKYGTDDEYVLASLKDGSCFGEYSLLTGKPGVYTVVAFTDMLIMKITGEDFSTFVEMNAKNSVDIMKSMARIINVLVMNIDMVLNEELSGGD